MRVLLIQPKSNYPDSKPYLLHIGQGLPYIAAAIRAAGHQPFGVNLNYEWFQGNIHSHLGKRIKNAITEYQPDLIAVGGLAPDFLFIRDAINSIRGISSNTPIVCGGGIVTFDAEFVFGQLRPDFALVGDAEESIVLLLEYLNGFIGIDSVPNCLYWQDGAIKRNAVIQLSRQLDLLPFPEYDIFDYETYYQRVNQSPRDTDLWLHTRQNPRVIPISLGRSCPFRCTFCLDAGSFGLDSGRQEYRTRSIQSAMLEILYFYEKYHFNFMFVYDELFSANKSRILEFCAELKRLKQEFKMDFDWTCSLRLNNVDRNILKEMKSSGCVYVMYGLESASDDVLVSMNKKITRADMINALNLSSEVGIGFQGNFIIGDFAETKSTVGITLDAYSTLFRDHMVGVGFVVPYPGSTIFNKCLENSIIQDKKQYYELIGEIKCPVINMTTMSDANFLDIINTDLRKPLSFRTAPIFSFKLSGLCPADLDAPVEEQRENVTIQVICPHCSCEIAYTIPFRTVPPEFIFQETCCCSQCHKKFIAHRPQQNRNHAMTKEEIDRVCIGSSTQLHWDVFQHLLADTQIRKICVCGVFFGRDVSYIANILNGYGRTDYTIYAIDEFEDTFCDDWPEEKRDLNWETAGFGPAQSLQQAQKNINSLCLGTNVNVLKMRDVDFLSNTDEWFDFIYLDISHDYNTVKKTIQLARTRLTDNGIIGGDDFSDEGEWGVKSAVNDSFAKFDLYGNWLWFGKGQDFLEEATPSLPAQSINRHGQSLNKNKISVGIRLNEIHTFDLNFRGFMNGDELIARSWAKYLQREEYVESVYLYGPLGTIEEPIDVLIHFNPHLELHPSVKNILYLQNAFPKSDHAGGTVGVFHRAKERFDGYIFTSQELMSACVPGAVVPFAADPEIFFPQPSGKYSLPVTFVGNNIRNFETNHRYLAPALPFGLVIYGGGWHSSPFISAYRSKLPMDDLAALYSDSFINLNAHIIEHREMNLINMRIYEIFACGGFVMSDHVPAVEKEFGDMVVCTNGDEDMWAKLVRYLPDKEERKRRSEEGRRCVLASHSYEFRVQTVVRYLREIL